MKTKLQKLLNQYGSSKEPFLFIISYDLSKFHIYTLKDLPSNIKYEIDNKTTKKSSKKYTLDKYPLSFEKYQEKFNTIQNHIKKGNSYLLNLTSKTKINTKLGLDEIYEKAEAKFKIIFKDKFVCFSPERFIQIRNNKIYTYPMKGTINAKVENAEAKILADAKEIAEHTMVVDLLRNDLGIVSNKINVEKFRYISKINAGNNSLLQVSSKISSCLSDSWHKSLGDIITSLLPAGSITGCPKKKTIEILEEIEDYDRDFYTGVFGVFDGESLDSSVMIRFIEKNKNNEYFYKSGGGITSDSDVYMEYKELIDKIYLPF